jgi:ferredoxin-type protein NapF
MDQQLTRSAVLRGRWRSEKLPRRPPWALGETAFVAACPPSCGRRCVEACPEAILSLAGDGRPQIHFERGECTFCAACVEACPSGALTREGDGPPWSLVARVAETCLSIAGVTCRSCGDACGEDAIRFSLGLNGTARPVIDGEACTGCGACVRPCPVEAITVQEPGLTKETVA